MSRSRDEKRDEGGEHTDITTGKRVGGGGLNRTVWGVKYLRRGEETPPTQTRACSTNSPAPPYFHTPALYTNSLHEREHQREERAGGAYAVAGWGKPLITVAHVHVDANVACAERCGKERGAPVA